MLKILKDKWAKNESRLREAISNLTDPPLEYEELVKLTFDMIYNDPDTFDPHKLETDNIKTIDDGSYDGTLLFLIPFNTYDHDEGDYLMTYVRYGSCGGCDTLLGITDYDDPPYNENSVTEFMDLCRHLVMNTIRPYNYGYRYDAQFDHVEF